MDFRNLRSIIPITYPGISLEIQIDLSYLLDNLFLNKMHLQHNHNEPKPEELPVYSFY